MGLMLCLLFWTALILIIIKLYVKLTTGWCRSNVCLLGKTAIITGANTGIGYETAADFAKRGARVILACRSESRGQDAVQRIINETGNKNVLFKHLDLDSFKSVKEFVKDINATEERLDILVNNAGVCNGENKKTEDDILGIMQTNHFGHFLLTNLLLDLLKNTKNSRIVNVSSLLARFCTDFDVNRLNVYPQGGGRSMGGILYKRSKVCNILFTIELAKRLKDSSVTAYSVHPGVVNTEIIRDSPPFAKMMTEAILKWFFKSSIEGAQTTIYCGVAKGIESESGEHFADCAFVTRYKTCQDPDLPGKLWKVSEDLVKVKSH